MELHIDDHSVLMIVEVVAQVVVVVVYVLVGNHIEKSIVLK
jgi:hypothetical protein